jgi:glutathione S-transferase
MEPPNPPVQTALRQWGGENVIERHDRLEEMIGHTRFLTADHPTLADGLLIGVARWLEYHEVADADRWPKLAAVRRLIEAEPAVAYAVALENGQMKPGSGACLGHVPLADLVAALTSTN